MEVENRLFLRKDVERLGIAPLTSMFWFAEYGRERPADWRPEVHDADGLAMWTGAGERIWRPLNNPTRIFVTTYSDDNPRGFGLSQRDRNFDHYLDGVGYEKRPSAWVEPLGGWGKGSVSWSRSRPTTRSTTTSRAFWLPAEPAQGRRRAQLPLPARTGSPPSPASRPNARQGGGDPHGPRRPARQAAPARRRPSSRSSSWAASSRPCPTASGPSRSSASRAGQVSLVQVEAVPDGVPGHWRVHFDLTVDGREPVDMRLFLRRGDTALSETWLYLFEPPMA